MLGDCLAAHFHALIWVTQGLTISVVQPIEESSPACVC